MVQLQRPIGYWLKHLDGLIEEHFARALAAEHVDRREWQVLNTLTDGPTTAGDLDQAVAPFLLQDPDGAKRAIQSLVERDWATAVDGRVALTESGVAAHEPIAQRVTASRRRIMDGVSPEEYAQVLDVLQRMAANLGAR